MSPERVQALLRTRRYGRSLRALDLSESTNDDARGDAAAGAPDGHVVLADGQRAGRGSHGRVWTSPGGTDLYLSIVALDVFVLVYMMTPERGGPDTASEVVGGVIWKYAFNHGEQAFASAIGVVLFFAALSLAVVSLRFGRRERIEF